MIVKLKGKAYKERELIGGKAFHLQKLDAMGFNVPNWMVVESTVLSAQLSSELYYDGIHKEFDHLLIPSDVHESVAAFCKQSSSATFAVRSSAVDEDGISRSFAGMYKTFLNVPEHDVEDKVVEVWKSLVSEHITTYREQQQVHGSMSMAVIVQEMIAPLVSGVAFGVHPLKNNETIVVNSVYGLGEGVVSGKLDADTFEIDGDEIISNIASKDEQFLLSEGITKIVSVPLERRAQPSLLNSQLLEIKDVLKRLENELKSPQDIEFSYDDSGRLIILQTRAVTKVIQKGAYTLWDNSNIVESYPGITTPLTYSFISEMYELVYKQFLGLLGVHKKQIAKNHEVFANTLGLIRGRVYYNLLNWYRMLAMLPAFSINKSFMENMMGVKERFDVSEYKELNKSLAWFRVIKMVIKLCWLNRSIKPKREKFQRYLNKVMSQYYAFDFAKMTDNQVLEKYNSFEEKLLNQWKAPLINDFLAMIWFGVLQKICVKNFGEKQNIHNNLLCGSSNIISVEPVHRILDLVDEIRKNEVFHNLFMSNTPEIIWERLSEPEFSLLQQNIQSYLEAFGERCIGELKLESISYAQNPVAFIRVLISYLQSSIIINKEDNRDAQIRAEAEADVAKRFAGKLFKRLMFNYVLRKARDMVSARENLRYERTRAFGMVRKMFRALGAKWAASGLLANENDIFYMNLNEIRNFSGLEQSTFYSNVVERIAEFDNYHVQEAPSDRFFTYGNNFTDEYIFSREKLEPARMELQGIGCSPGKVKAKVRVVIDPNECTDLDGEILVARSTDPGWVTLFPKASAILVEKGSLLSHSAIVSREMGIPCVVSIDGLLRSLQSGDLVEMDGSSGVVRKLSPENE